MVRIVGVRAHDGVQVSILHAGHMHRGEAGRRDGHALCAKIQPQHLCMQAEHMPNLKLCRRAWDSRCQLRMEEECLL